MLKERDAWLDNVKAILITLVIIGHLISPITKWSDLMLIIYQVIFFFHMPCFIILSGYFSKRRINQKDGAAIVNKLLIPFLIWNFGLYVLYTFTGSLERYTDYNTPSLFIWLRPIYALWYIWAIFLYSCITIYLNNRIKSKGKFLFLTLILSVGIGFFEPIKYMQISKIISFYPYFYLGYILENEKLNLLKDKRLKVFSGAVFIVISLFTIKYHNYIPRQIYLMELPYYTYMGDIMHGAIVRVIMIGVAIILSAALLNLTSTKNNLFTYVGRYSIYGYVLHTYCIMLSRIIDVKLVSLYKRVNTLEEYILILVVGMLLSALLASTAVRQKMKHFVEPHCDIKVLLKNITG